MLKLREKKTSDETKEPLRLILCSNNQRPEATVNDASTGSGQGMQDWLFNDSELNDINSDSD